MVDHQGDMLDGDELLYIIVKDQALQDKLQRWRGWDSHVKFWF